MKRHPSGNDTTPLDFNHEETTRERLVRLGERDHAPAGTRVVYSWPDEPCMPNSPTTPGSKVPR